MSLYWADWDSNLGELFGLFRGIKPYETPPCRVIRSCCFCVGECFICLSFVFIGVLLENFPICKELLIPPGTQNYMVRMRLYDVNKRLLNLTIRIVCRAEGSLKILISAPYWLINKTGKFAAFSFMAMMVYWKIKIWGRVLICFPAKESLETLLKG